MVRYTSNLLEGGQMKSKLFTRNFSLLIAGQTISLFANCILDFAFSMYILEQTGSATIFAGVLAISMLPTIILSPLGGVLADRANRRNIMVFLDFTSGLVIMICALLINRGNDLTVICVSLVLLSILGAFESPTVQACVPQMQSGDNIVRGNAVVNQISALSVLIGPFVGSLLYTALGLKIVLYAGTACFFATALFECFIKLPHIKTELSSSILTTVRNDLSSSSHYISKVRPSILKTLILIAVISFFIQGVALIGLPYIVRNTLNLSANYYGVAESLLGCAGLVGSIIAGLIVTKFHIKRLSEMILGMGFFLFPIGVAFLFPASAIFHYIVLLIFFAVIQVIASLFSVFGLSIIQQLTPQNMAGKVMSFVATITLCSQPISQILYGIAFDLFSSSVYWVIIPTGVALCMIGLSSKLFFTRLEQQLKENCDT